jgi:hypothetical protein
MDRGGRNRGVEQELIPLLFHPILSAAAPISVNNHHHLPCFCFPYPSWRRRRRKINKGGWMDKGWRMFELRDKDWKWLLFLNDMEIFFSLHHLHRPCGVDER